MSFHGRQGSFITNERSSASGVHQQQRGRQLPDLLLLSDHIPRPPQPPTPTALALP